jgi:hypothetical protein
LSPWGWLRRFSMTSDPRLRADGYPARSLVSQPPAAVGAAPVLSLLRCRLPHHCGFAAPSDGNRLEVLLRRSYKLHRLPRCRQFHRHAFGTRIDDTPTAAPISPWEVAAHAAATLFTLIAIVPLQAGSSLAQVVDPISTSCTSSLGIAADFAALMNAMHSQ